MYPSTLITNCNWLFWCAEEKRPEPGSRFKASKTTKSARPAPAKQGGKASTSRKAKKQAEDASDPNIWLPEENASPEQTFSKSSKKKKAEHAPTDQEEEEEEELEEQGDGDIEDEPSLDPPKPKRIRRKTGQLYVPKEEYKVCNLWRPLESFHSCLFIVMVSSPSCEVFSSRDDP